MCSLIDTHAHLDEMEDLEVALENARKHGVVAVIAMGSDLRSNERVLELAQKYKGLVFPALGLHPWTLAKGSAEVRATLRFLEENLPQAVALGEVGLDYQKRLVSQVGKELQKEVLARVLELARKYDKPASIHSRYAWRDCFTVVRESGIRRAVFHWYTGPINVLREALAEGYLASATPALAYHEEHRRVVKETPLSKLVLETDSPVAYRGRRAEPADVLQALKLVAELKRLGQDIVAEETTKNARMTFGI